MPEYENLGPHENWRTARRASCEKKKRKSICPTEEMEQGIKEHLALLYIVSVKSIT